MIGKVPPAELAAKILDRTGASDDAVIQGPAYGEDTAAIDLGDDVLVVNADPLSLAAEEVGRLAVHVVCNDVAASGAAPRWATNMLFLPDDDPETLDTITQQIDETADALGVSIIGGHAEYAPELSRPMLALSAMGRTDRYVPTGGAEPGDVVLIAGSAAIEGTAILASDFAGQLREAGVEPSTLETAASFINDISVIPAAMAIRDVASGMHDPTEGGVVTGLIELAAAADLTIDIESDRIPVRPETRALSQPFDIDPLRMFGSGALLASVPERSLEQATSALEDAGVEFARIGVVVEGDGHLVLDGEPVTETPRDELYTLWE